ncbi:hypothetical protein FJT64_006657 [Amphibalanus amphitrite]|uniref:Uncharacterized protein n=1 Tax=Amphibalanus amphitrite TaxID=1232801 RepID=A0A6A4VYC1_AMPAM|nr:hypothetical protein FJT64_006657 [Amphibalanus amphitrite]
MAPPSACPARGLSTSRPTSSPSRDEGSPSGRTPRRRRLEAAKKKKRRLPRLRIRFTRKKRSAHVEWPPEALEAAERAGSSSPPPSVAERPPRDPRVSRLAERPASGAGDDVTSSGLGSSWETGLSVCSSPALERPGLARHASLRRSERRTLRASRGRSGSPGSDSFRRTVSCPDGLGWGGGETEHPAVPLPPAGAGAETDTESSRTANLGGNGDATASDTVASVSAVSSFASPPGGSDDRHTVSPSADPPSTDHSARPAPAGSVSVERTFAAQLAHLRPLAAGVRHYWRLRHEEERLGTFHVHEASVEFEQLPRNIQPFVLYHRPLVAEIKTFWAQKRKALRARARNCESANSSVASEEYSEYSEQYSERDGGAGGDGVGDGAVEIPVQRDDGEPAKGDEPRHRDSDGAVCRTDTATDSHGVSESARPEPRPAPDADTVRQVRADLDSLRPLQDFGPDAADGERRAAELSRSASFASARSFWRSLQDLRPIQESDRLRKKVSFREQQVQRRQDPVAVFFRHLLHKSESSQEVSRPPPAEADGQGEPHRSTLPVEPRRRPAHTRSLPNAVVARVEPKPQRRWPRRPEEPSDWRWIQDPPLKEAADPPEPPSVRHLRQALGSKPVQPVAPYHLQRQAPATASSRRFIRPGVVRRLQAQFEDLARQH